MPNPPDEFVRSTVRLPKDLHSLVRQHSLRSGLTIEEIIHAALRRELSSPEAGRLTDPAVALYESIRRSLDAFRHGHADVAPGLEPIEPLPPRFEWTGWEAYRFLQNLPVMAVIKNTRAEIVFCNLAYERQCQMRLAHLRGKKVTEIGLLKEEDRKLIEKDIALVLKGDSPLEALETAIQPGRPGSTLLRVYRFLFEAGGTRYLGDLSFDFYKMSTAHEEDAEAPTDLSIPETSILAICKSFLESSPAAAVIKDRRRRLLWANASYLTLAKKVSVEEIRGQTAEQVFSLPSDHPITVSDASVVKTARWRFGPEEIDLESGRRESIRFPIFGAEHFIEEIGALSAQFKLSVRYQSDAPNIANGVKTKSGQNGRSKRK